MAAAVALTRARRGGHDSAAGSARRSRATPRKDAFQPAEYPHYWRVFETRDDYFDYYRPYHAFWKLYGIDLPDSVLKKVYYRNALRVTAGLPRAGWPRESHDVGQITRM